MTRTAQASGRGARIEVELDRADLLPGRLAPGRVRLAAERAIEARGLLATLVGTETWQYQTTERDANGNTRTRTVTRREVLRRVPVQLIPAGTIAAGEREIPFEIPVPPLGPASLDATVAAMTWELEVKLDLPGFDVRAELPVRVLQPTALLRAGVVRVGQFALWEGADASRGDLRATVDLDPVPLCLGQPFRGRIELASPSSISVQEVRLELRTKVRATVSSGLSEEITIWTHRLVEGGQLEAGSRVFEITERLPSGDLATVELPHGESDAQLHLIIARRMARDPHLIRDVAVCTTTEL